MVNVRFILTFFWIILFDNLNAQNYYPESGSERLYQFAKMVGAPYTNLTDSVANNFDNLEDDLIRWVSRDFSEQEINYFITSRIDSSNCRQKVCNKIWNFNRRSYIKSRLYYIKFKHHYLKPYNYHMKFNQRYPDGYNAFFKHLSSNYPALLDSLYQQQYDIKRNDLLNQLNKIAVGDAIYVLGLIDSYKSIPLLETIIQDTLKYEKSDIEVAKLALARLGNRMYEDSILKYSTISDTLTKIDCYKLFDNYVYISTQQSVYKFTDFLRYNDGDPRDSTVYLHCDSIGTVKVFLFFRKRIIFPGASSSSFVISNFYIPIRYYTMEYLFCKLHHPLFDGLEESGFLKVPDEEIDTRKGRKFFCHYLFAKEFWNEKSENMLKWLEDNKDNYKLNRRVLFFPIAYENTRYY